jgi:hypothetical protein
MFNQALYARTCALIQLVETDFGRVIGVPRARFKMSCDNIPNARDTANMTV